MGRAKSLFERVLQEHPWNETPPRGRRALAAACDVLESKLPLLRKAAEREEPPLLTVAAELTPLARKLSAETFSCFLDKALGLLIEDVGFRSVNTTSSTLEPPWLYKRLTTFYRPAEELVFDHLSDRDPVLLFTTQEEHRFLTALLESRSRLSTEHLFVWTLASGFLEPDGGRLLPTAEPRASRPRKRIVTRRVENAPSPFPVGQLMYEAHQYAFFWSFDEDDGELQLLIHDENGTLTDDDLAILSRRHESQILADFDRMYEANRRNKMLESIQGTPPALRFAQGIRNALNPDWPDATYVFLDVHRELAADHNGNVAENIRVIRDAYHQLLTQRGQRRLLLFGHDFTIPEDLLQEIPNVDLPLPTRSELTVAVTRLLDPAHSDEELIARAVDALTGLTLQQSTSALERIIRREVFDASTLVEKLQLAKSQQLKSDGVLEVVRDLPTYEAGGLDRLTAWLKNRQQVFERPDEAAKHGIDRRPKGLLMLGISGSGKSLAAKQVARNWGLPLLRFDAGSIYDKWVGSSEARLRRALKVAETIAPCVLWIDEIEKGFGSTNDSTGVSQRVLGTLLVWMQENTSAVFTVATANDITRLPPELTRAGRFDSRFFLGCPAPAAREEILKVHLKKRRCDPSKLLTDQLLKATHGFTGAELEQVVLDALFAAFEVRAELNTDHLEAAAARTRPLITVLGRTMDQVWDLIEHGRVELASSDTLSRKDVAQLIDPFRFSPMYCRLKNIQGYEKHAERAERMISSQPSFGSTVCVLQVEDPQWIYAQCNFTLERTDSYAFKFLDRFITIETNDVFFMLCRENALEAIIFETKELEELFRASPYLGELSHLFGTFGAATDATDRTINLLTQQRERQVEH